MNRHHPRSSAPSRVASKHLGEPTARRRRTLQRCSAVVASLFLGASQCDAPATPVASAADPAATTVASTTTLAPTHPASAGAVAPTPVVVHGPDGTAAHGRCTQYEDLLMIHAPAVGWDVQRMSRLAWRESNCWPEIRSRTSDTGLLQINDITLEFLNDELGEPVDRYTLTDPVQNVRAAAALCSFWERNGSSCYQPWSTN